MPEINQKCNELSDYQNNKHSINNNSQTVVTILHFNDCYNVEPRSQEPSGGAARFLSALNSFSDCHPLVLFSGDIMAPSIMSSFTKGEQMIPVLNALAIDCGLFGNHEFDFGVDHLKTFVSKTRFPWLMSNVYDNQTDCPIGSAHKWHIITKNDKKFGIIGLVEKQWVIDSIDSGYTYRDFISEAKTLAKHLKEEEFCDFVIALTHMRWPNDTLLAENVAEIDLILGGHDHDYLCRQINNKYCIKSGTDFRQFSKIDIEFIGRQKYQIKCSEISVNSFDFEEDQNLKQELQKYLSLVESQMDTVLGYNSVELDGRFSSNRCHETNLGNMICDIVLTTFGVDAVIINSGTFRSDQIHNRGEFKVRDLVRILPMMDELVVLRLTGHQLWQTLECGVSRWPVLDGSFAQVSRIRYQFDISKPIGARIDPKCILIGDKSLNFNKTYRIVTKEFLHKGKDGYSVLKDTEVLLSSDQCLNLFILVKNYFESIAKTAANSEPKYLKQLQCCTDSSLLDTDLQKILCELRKFEPKVEGRITCLTD